MAAPTIQFKRGASSGITSFKAGEPAFTTDTFDFYIGLENTLETNKFFGSHRYWTRETGSAALNLNLVDKDGTNKISLKSPDTLSGVTTYTLPETPVDTYLLTTNGSGVLSWTNAIPGGTLTGVTTFTDTTDNTLGNANTGAVQIDGGLGVNKNVTVGGNLNVQGYSEFVGVATFKGGTINLGDDNTDDINVGGEFISGLVPNTDDSHDLGASGKRWKTLNVVNIDTTNISASGISTFTGLVDANGGLDVTGQTELDDANISGIATIQNLDVQNDFDIYAPTATFHDNVIIEGNLTVNGTETIINTTTLTVQDKEIILGVGTNGSPNDASATGGGVSIASTEGNPLVDFYLVGVHTHPTTYKDIVWIRADDLGVGTTDAWHFNYAVGIGSTQVPNGVRLAVTNTQITDSTLSTPQINVSGASTIGGLLDVNGGLDVTGQVTLNNDLLVSGISTFTGAIDANGGATIDNIQIGITGDNEIDTSSGNLTIDSAGGTVTIDDELIVSGDVRINGNDIKASDGNTNITLTSNTLTTFAGDIRVNGNDLQASDGNTNITMTSNTLTAFAGDVKVGGNDIQASDGNVNITMTSNTLTEVKGDLKVTGNDIQDSGGNAALTFDGSQNVTANNDLTVTGNLYVSGSTTQVNTDTLTVEDRTIELGLVDGNTPGLATTWDLGVLFNYNASGAKKSGVVWEHADARFKFASEVSDGGGTGVNSPQITFTAYAPIEISALWVNDCAGQSQVISCTGSERFLENITIDGGSF